MSKAGIKALLCLALSGATASCFIIRTTSIRTMTPEGAIGTDIRTPLKAFHADGTITVFAYGARVTSEAVFGSGERYSLDLNASAPVQSVALDSLVGIEAFQGGINPAATFLASTLATAASIAGFKAAFGSCPTIYTYQDEQEVLEAEAFSYSIAPLLEARDVDRLGVRPDPRGVLRLEVRNEALETHYINQMEVLEATHALGRRAYPNESGRVVSVGPSTPPLEAHDRDGRDVTRDLLETDDRAYAATDERIRAVTSEDYWEHLELRFPRPAAGEAALVLRLRNSLLNTVLFYDMMLGAHGAEALEWLGDGMNRIGQAVELGRWFSETMGMRVSVLRPGGWDEVAKVGDTGPIAWKELAISVPVPDTEELRIRLTFLVDEWRIDYAALAADVERAEVRRLAVASAGRLGEAPDERWRYQLAEADDEYLITSAGTAAYLEFEAGVDERPLERTYFIASQGYYTEWIRPQWLRADGATGRFEPGPEVVVDLMSRWSAEKEEYERTFYATRMPVRRP